MNRWLANRPDEQGRGGEGGQAIRQRLIILVSVLILSTILVASLLLAHAYSREKAAAEFQLQATARALSLVVDRQLGQQEILLRTLSASHALASGDFAIFDQEARRAVPSSGSWIVLRNAAGQQIVNTRLPAGTALPGDGVMAARHFKTLVENHVNISGLISATVADRPIIAVEWPIFNEGALSYVLAMIFPPSELSTVFADQKLPADWVELILDRAGVIVSRSHNGAVFTGRSVDPKFFEGISQADTEGIREGISLEGERRISGFSRSSISGWTFLVSVPGNTLAAAARRSLVFAVLIGIGLSAVGALIARRVARGISRPIEGLAVRAAALGRGEAIPEGLTGLAEADLVADALHDAGESLALLRATLEQRVVQRTEELAQANNLLSNEIEERKRAEQHLAHAQRLEAVGQLTGGIAHDFNNLLQAVIGNLDLVRLRVAEKGARKFLDNAIAAAERGSRLTGQLLAFSRKQRLEATVIDVNSLVSGTTDMLRSTIGGTIEIRTDLAPDCWPALADATQLELIILNLAINARDAIASHGLITISTANVTRGEPTHPEDPPAGEFVALSVSDNGSGMPPEILAKVFEPFFTTKGVGKGSGLGLSQVLGLAQQLGGGATIESELGRGTVVRVFLPRTDAPRAETQAAAVKPQDRLAETKLLLVDDDEAVRVVLGEMLRDLGCVVIEADSGEAALKQVADGQKFDLVLLDYAMPCMNGAETADRIREIDPNLAILFVTGYPAETGTLDPSMSEHVMSKPIRAADLAQRLKSILQARA